MTQVLLGSLLLSLIHAVIPNHWLPLVALGKAQGWSRSETLLVTAIAGLAHVSSTIAIGVLVGLLGYQLSSASLMSSMIPPAVLVGMGIIYLALDAKRGHRHQHAPHARVSEKASTVSIVASLCAAMFFSPCAELEAYYLSAGRLGWPGVIAVSAVYLVVAVLGMIVLVDLGLRGIERIRSSYLEHHERRVTGTVLVGLGVFAALVEF